MSAVLARPSGSPFDLPLAWKDQSQTPNGGQHPWRNDAGFTSTLTLYNPDPRNGNSVDVSVFAGVKKWNKKVVVAPLSTVAVRINDIVAAQQPDDHGNTLPRDAATGMVSWSTLAKPKIIGLLSQIDSIAGIVRPFACAQAYAICSISLPADTVVVGDSTGTVFPSLTTCGVSGTPNDCACIESCNTAGTGLANYSWFSVNSSILSLTTNPTFSTANYQGVSTGITFKELSGADNLGCTANGTGQSNVVIGFNADIPSTLYNDVASRGGGGGSAANVEAEVAASGVINTTQSALTTDNLNILGVGNLSGVGDTVDATFESYVEQMGYSYQGATTVPGSNPAGTAIPALIRIWVTASTPVAAGAVVLGACLLMTGDHPAGWDPSRSAQCAAQQQADQQECARRFPFASGQGAKYRACITHSWVRHTLCMKGMPVPPLQPVN